MARPLNVSRLSLTAWVLSGLVACSSTHDIAELKFKNAPEVDGTHIQSARSLLAVARVQRSAGNTPLAESLLRDLLRERPAYVGGHVELASMQLEVGNLMRARQALDAGLAVAPEDLELLRLEGAYFLARGDLERSHARYWYVADAAPQSPVAARNLALVLVMQGKEDMARETLTLHLGEERAEAALRAMLILRARSAKQPAWKTRAPKPEPEMPPAQPEITVQPEITAQPEMAAKPEVAAKSEIAPQSKPVAEPEPKVEPMAKVPAQEPVVATPPRELPLKLPAQKPKIEAEPELVQEPLAIPEPSAELAPKVEELAKPAAGKAPAAVPLEQPEPELEQTAELPMDHPADPVEATPIEEPEPVVPDPVETPQPATFIKSDWRGIPQERLKRYGPLVVQSGPLVQIQFSAGSQLTVIVDRYAKTGAWVLGPEFDYRLEPGSRVRFQDDGSFFAASGEREEKPAPEGRPAAETVWP